MSRAMFPVRAPTTGDAFDPRTVVRRASQQACTSAFFAWGDGPCRSLCIDPQSQTVAHMGSLALHLAEQFERFPPASWTIKREQRLFDARMAQRLDFDPRVDILLEGASGRRVAVEFEVSRADPVANQVKFFLALEQGALRPDDFIVSMLSSHIEPGRRAIAAAFTRHMRTQGVSAFQVSLMPFTKPADVKALNQLTREALRDLVVPVRDEIARVVDIVDPRGDVGQHRVHFAGDVTDVVANLWTFNDRLADEGVATWRRRSVQFFVVDPASGLFAPSKFCAFVPASGLGGAPPPPTMTFSVYASLGEDDPRFDGNVARRHLARRLAFDTVLLDESQHGAAFAAWHGERAKHISLRQPVTLLVPPRWHWDRAAR
jgi:hypothetical protein